MKKPFIAAIALLAATSIDSRASAATEILGQDAGTCSSGQGPAVLVNIVGLKDRVGELWVELYPPNDDDFLRAEEELAAQGKVFRRTRAKAPATATASSVSMCIRAPRPGRYALLLRHNRTGQDKFALFSDGIGFPANTRLGRSRPKLRQALIDVGTGMVTANIKLQYLRGFVGFAPLQN